MSETETDTYKTAAKITKIILTCTVSKTVQITVLRYQLSEYISRSKIHTTDSSETSEDPYISARLRYASEYATMRGCIPQSTSHRDHVKTLTS